MPYFLIPGDLSLKTGGYAYDRAVLSLMLEEGMKLEPLALAGTFPYPAVEVMEETARLIAALPAKAPLLIDGLAYGAMSADFIRRFNRPIIALCHHPLALENGLSEKQAALFHASEKTALELADHVVVTSRLTGKILEGEFAVPTQKITVAEPGTTRKPRAQGSNGGEKVAILAVGSLIPRKGYHILLEALANIKHLRWHLTIVGGSPIPTYTEALHQQIEALDLKERIDLRGALDEAALDHAFATADLFVSPSLFEGYGMALGEALQRGLPIIASTGGAAEETLPEGAGVKIPPGEVKSLENALTEMISSPLMRQNLGEAAFLAGQNLPQWQDTTRIIADVLRKFMN